jgi:hypothetical protein
MKLYRFELQDVSTLQIIAFFIEANNMLEAAKLVEKDNYKYVSGWQL